MFTAFAIDPWRLTERDLPKAHLRLSESLTSIGNGLMGMRGNFEENYSGDSHRGTYFAGVWFPDKTRVGWWKNGYPQYFGKVPNAMNLISMRVIIDDTELDLAQLPVTQYERTLDMVEGTLTRTMTVAFPKGEVQVYVQRFVSVANREILGIRMAITPSFDALVQVLPALDADVRNLDSNYDEVFWSFEGQGEVDHALYVTAKTCPNPFGTPRFAVSAAMRCDTVGLTPLPAELHEGYACQMYAARAQAGETLSIDKLVAIATTRDDAEERLSQTAVFRVERAFGQGYDALLEAHIQDWAQRWAIADVHIQGDDAAQQGIRFNLFQLFSTYYGEDPRLNIGPKGFTGEKYGGATYWDTEAYCFPLYLALTGPEVAKNLLRYRFLQLDGARHNARQQGLEGALYPMVTFNGVECHNEWEITFEEIHRNAAIAYAIFAYIAYTGDESYLEESGLDVLIEIARFWVSRVHYNKSKGVYMIHGVTGPNEYENNVSNNWYTNRMAIWCLRYAIEASVKVSSQKREALGITPALLSRMQEIADKLYLPQDSERGIFVQHDTFLDKDLMPASALDPSQRPINQHWSWDRILRSCFIKQADVLQGLYFLGHLYDQDTKRRNFDFYEPMTVHESSLSPCVHSILAAELGLKDKAVELYRRTARLDLDNVNNDTEDGLHITSMAGGWLSIVQGFAGMRTVGGLSLNPFLPEGWQGYGFAFGYRGRRIALGVTQGQVKLELLEGEPLELLFMGEKVSLGGQLTRLI